MTILSRSLVVAFVASCIILPSGTIYSVNVKIILSLMLLCSVFWEFMTSAVNCINYVAVLTLSMFVVFYFMVGVLNGVPAQYSLSQSLAVFSCFAAIYLPLFFVLRKSINTEFLVFVLIKSFGVLCALKLLLEIYMLTGAGLEQTKYLISSIFGVSFIGLDAGIFYRIHLPSDYLAPAVLYSMLRRNELGLKLNKNQTKLIFILTLVSVGLSYSRYLWLFSFLSILLASISYTNLKIKIAIPFLLPLFIAWLFIFENNPVYGFFKERFFGQYAQSSDSTRVDMFLALIEAINEKPFLGWGLGASTPGYTNIETVPWYYEMQWLGFAMQFGLVGLTALLLVSMLITGLIMKKPITNTKIGLLLLYFIWLMLGLFNGFMLTSAGGIVFLMFISLGLKANQTQKTKVNPYVS